MADLESFGNLNLAEMFVFGEEIIEDPQGWLEVKVDNVFRPRFGLGKSGILHQLKGQGHISDLFLESLKEIKWCKWQYVKFCKLAEISKIWSVSVTPLKYQ